jgi:hypothetical protein
VGEQWGKVRALVNDKGDRVKEAGPSVPVEVLGLNGTPEAGDVLNVVETEAQAREIAEYREQAAKDRAPPPVPRPRSISFWRRPRRTRTSSRTAHRGEGRRAGLCRGDHPGDGKDRQRRGARARAALGVGAITESDIGLAEASGAPVIGFNVRANAPARNSANQKGVEIRYYSVIYDLVDDVKAAASGPAGCRGSRELHRLCRDQGGLQGLRRGQGRRLSRHRRRRAPLRRCAPAARRRGDPRRHAEDAQALQGRGGRSSPARNAAWPSRTTTTSARAT